MIHAKNIKKHELIGLEIKIVDSENKSLVGKEGEIIDESKNTFTIKQNGEEKTLLKSAIVFQAKIGGKTVQVDGKALVKRPEDRIKK